MKKNHKEVNLTNLCLRTSAAVNNPTFKCKYCEKSFAFMDVLQGHIKIDHKDKLT